MSDGQYPRLGEDEITPPRGIPKPFTQANTTLSPRGRDSDRTERDSGDDYDDWDDDDEWGNTPNYLVRRVTLLAIVAGVLVIGVLAALRWWVGDEDESAADATNWNTVIVVLDDEIQILDRESLDEIDSIDTGPGLLDDQFVVNQNTFITMTDQGRISQYNLNDGQVRRGRAGLDQVLRLSNDNPAIALVADDAGSDVIVVDTVRSSVLSIGDAARLDNPLIFADSVLVNPAATHVAAPVPIEFYSVVIDLETENVQAVPGRVIALDDTRVVVEQPAGDKSEIGFRELTGERMGTADVPSPVFAFLQPAGDLILVEADGSVRSANDGGDVSELTAVHDGNDNEVTVERGHVVAGGERLLLTTSAGVVLLDQAGAQIDVFEGTISPTINRESRCAILGGASSTDPLTVVDLDAGAVITEIDRGFVTTTSIDGCTAAIQGGPSPRLLLDGEVRDIDADSIDAIAPDGSAYVVLDGRDAEYFTVGSEDGPVEIADEQVTIRFGRREE